MSSGPTEILKNITNKDQFPKIFDKYFKKNVFLKTKTENIHIDFKHYKNGLAT